MPSLIQLQYAIAVEKHRHFGKASRSCHVTQPTLSQQIQKLEEEVGIVLFDRDRKPVLPTPEGQRFLEQAKVVLREQEKLLSIAKQSKTGEPSGDFRLAIIPTVASDLLPIFLKAFARGCMRTYLILKDKAACWNEDPEIQALVAEINADDGSMNQYFGKYSSQKAEALGAETFDRSALAVRGFKYERLDQLTVEVLLGVR